MGKTIVKKIGWAIVAALAWQTAFAQEAKVRSDDKRVVPDAPSAASRVTFGSNLHKDLLAV